MRLPPVVLAVILALVALPACGDPAPENAPDSPPVDVPDPDNGPAVPDVVPAAGQAIIQASCTSCHGAEKVESASMSREGWEQQVEMCTSDAPLPEETAAKLIAYLAEKHGED